MTKQILYRGYEIVGAINKKIRVIIHENRHFLKTNEVRGGKIHLFHEPQISFVFKNYDAAVKFMDENPR